MSVRQQIGQQTTIATYHSLAIGLLNLSKLGGHLNTKVNLAILANSLQFDYVLRYQSHCRDGASFRSDCRLLGRLLQSFAHRKKKKKDPRIRMTKKKGLLEKHT